jgi:hypothetical protein
MYTVLWLEDLMGRDRLEDLGVRWMGGCELNASVSEQGLLVGPCENREFLD